MNCNRIAIAGVLAAVIAVPALAQSQPTQSQPSPSIAELSREIRRNKKPPTHVYTNDNLPHESSISVTGTLAPEKKPDDATAAAAAPSSSDDRKKAGEELAGKIADQQKEIAQLARELDVLQRENKMRAALYYSDAGNRLRDEKKYAEDDRKYQADIADKQKQLDAANKTLDDLKEAARRAGGQ